MTRNTWIKASCFSNKQKTLRFRFCTMIGLYCPLWFWQSQHTNLLNCKTELGWFPDESQTRSYTLHVFANLLTFQNTNEFLVKKNKQTKTTGHPHTACTVKETSPQCPLTQKADRLKPKESDSLTVWGRLVAHNRCYPLINNTVCQGWASHPFEADCNNFDTHKK